MNHRVDDLKRKEKKRKIKAKETFTDELKRTN